jgi:hypothetical protein
MAEEDGDNESSGVSRVIGIVLPWSGVFTTMLNIEIYRSIVL